ncbi:MAG TPA: LysM domain-containing protein [Candidatus Limnocylindrales bacterium]
MTERGLPIADGATACPFVAFESDRDERASVPDHRHRCYAETRPAPRALAHQEAYCLSSAFPVCPTFQDWARREAARSRGEPAPTGSAWGGTAAVAAAGAASAAPRSDGPTDDTGANDLAPDPGEALPAAAFVAAAHADADPGGAPQGDAGVDGPDGDDDSLEPAGRDDEPVYRNPPRDWAAPPPWLASSDAGRSGADAEPPPFLGKRSEPGAGLAGSAADQLAGGAPPPRRPDSTVDPWTAAAAAGAAAAAAGSGAAAGPAPHGTPAADDHIGYQEGPPNRIPRRPRAYDQHLGGPPGPDWEQPRRQEAYPEIKARVGMPQLPRIVLTAGVVALLAIALFFLPGILNIGGIGTPPAASASPSAAADQSIAPTEPPAPTPQVYTIKKGDTLLKVARTHGLTLEELLTANPAIKNPNKVSEGQQIVIPVPSASDGSGPASAAPSRKP